MIMSCKKETKDNINKKTFSICLENSSDISDYNEIHKHDFVEVIYVLSGELEFIIDFASCKIKKGDSVLINSNIYHAVLRCENSEFEFLRWSFLPEYVYAYGKDIYNIELFLWFAIKERNSFSVINTKDVPEINDLFLRALGSFSKKAYGYELDIHADTLNLCLPYLDKWHKENSDYVRDISGITIGEIKKVLSYIEKNYESVSFEELSKNFNIKNQLFSKNFKIITKYGVADYIELWRIKSAMFLLATTTQKVTEVATSVGYSTPSYFSKKFHSYSGMSPSEFRQLNITKIDYQNKFEEEKIENKKTSQERLFYDSILASIFYERFISDESKGRSFFRIIYVDKGYIELECEEVRYNLKEGDIFLGCPDELIYSYSDRTIKKGIFMIDFYPEFLNFGEDDNYLYNDLLYYTKNSCRLFHVEENDTEVLEALNQVNLGRIERGINFELIMRASYTKIIAWMLKKQFEKSGAVLPIYNDRASDNIEQILKYIDEHYMEKISMKEIADKFFVNYSYLSRTLKKITGDSFNNYIQKKKLLKATFLLVTTDDSVGEISQKLGYCSQGYFTELFIKKMNMTPSEFKKRFKNKEPYTDAYRYEYYEY